MGFSEQWLMSQDIAFRQDLRIAMVKVAVLIAGEAKGSLTNPQWFKRGALASQILSATVENGTVISGIDRYLDVFALATAQNGVIGDQSVPWSGLDGDMEFQVTAIWDDIAGVTGHDLTQE